MNAMLLDERTRTVDEPSATDKARSILPLYDITRAVACSAAFPTMGRITNPINP